MHHMFATHVFPHKDIPMKIPKAQNLFRICKKWNIMLRILLGKLILYSICWLLLFCCTCYCFPMPFFKYVLDVKFARYIFFQNQINTLNEFKLLGKLKLLPQTNTKFASEGNWWLCKMFQIICLQDYYLHWRIFLKLCVLGKCTENSMFSNYKPLIILFLSSTLVCPYCHSYGVTYCTLQFVC